MSEKSILEMIGGEKHINPHYNIKAEKMNIDEMKDRIARAEEIQRYTENRCESLEKKNAELKEQLGNKVMQKQKDKADLVWKLKTANEQKADQLTKAKEIIKGLKAHLDLSDCVNNDYRLQLLKQAEQFLSSQPKE